jgi:hypothetical protein
MLFEFVSGLVDIVHEKPYPGVVTLRSSTYDAVAYFEEITPNKVLKVPHHLYPWILHLCQGNLPSEISQDALKDIEVLERLTPEPVAFAVEWTYRDEHGVVVSDYDVCWPQDQDIARNRVAYDHDELIDVVSFLPLFEIPKKLLGISEEADEGL